VDDGDAGPRPALALVAVISQEARDALDPILLHVGGQTVVGALQPRLGVEQKAHVKVRTLRRPAAPGGAVGEHTAWPHAVDVPAEFPEENAAPCGVGRGQDAVAGEGEDPLPPDPEERIVEQRMIGGSWLPLLRNIALGNGFGQEVEGVELRPGGSADTTPSAPPRIVAKELIVQLEATGGGGFRPRRCSLGGLEGGGLTAGRQRIPSCRRLASFDLRCLELQDHYETQFHGAIDRHLVAALPGVAAVQKEDSGAKQRAVDVDLGLEQPAGARSPREGEDGEAEPAGDL